MDTSSKGKTFEPAKFFVTPDDMIRYMDAHFDTTVCPQCGKDDGWEIDGQVNENGEQQLIVYRLAYAETAKTFRPFFSMNCNACGSNRQIIGDKVMAWLSANPKEAAHE